MCKPEDLRPGPFSIRHQIPGPELNLTHPVFNAVQVTQGQADVDEHDEKRPGNLWNVGSDLLVDGVRKTFGDHELHREVGGVVIR